jgi:hypothetical protein
MKVNELIGKLLAYSMECEVVNKNQKPINVALHKDYERAEEWIEIT